MKAAKKDATICVGGSGAHYINDRSATLKFSSAVSEMTRKIMDAEFVMVQPNNIEIDESYQRANVSEKKIRAIAEAFSWVAFGALSCVRRKDGRLMCVDGQHRLLASKLAGADIVPCLVFDGSAATAENEAAAFLQINTVRTNVAAADKYRSAVLAGVRPEVEIDAWLKANRIRVACDSGSGSRVVDFITTVIQSWNRDQEIAKRAILAQIEAVGDEQLSVYVHKGFCWLIEHGVDVTDHAPKIFARGGRSAMISAIRSVQAVSGSSANGATCGRGILDVINRGRTRKIRVA